MPSKGLIMMRSSRRLPQQSLVLNMSLQTLLPSTCLRFPQNLMMRRANWQSPPYFRMARQFLTSSRILPSPPYLHQMHRLVRCWPLKPEKQSIFLKTATISEIFQSLHVLPDMLPQMFRKISLLTQIGISSGQKMHLLLHSPHQSLLVVLRSLKV